MLAAGLRPGPDPRLLRALLRRVRAPGAPAARRQLARLGRPGRAGCCWGRSWPGRRGRCAPSPRWEPPAAASAAAPARLPGPDSLPDGPALAPYVLKARELAYGWPGGVRPRADASLMEGSAAWRGRLAPRPGLPRRGARGRRHLRLACALARGTPQDRCGGLDARDLVARRDALLQQLRELEDTAAKRTPEQLALERYALELEAARALRWSKRRLGPRRAPASPGSPPTRPRKTGAPCAASSGEPGPWPRWACSCFC